jgi:endoplasmic reticulum protein 29
MSTMATAPKMAAFLASFILAAFVPVAVGINCKGCTPLDGLSFDKMINKFRVSVVKFDVAYPYGDKHEEFAKFSVDAAEVEDLLVGEVGIKDYGEKDNNDLGDRFGVNKEDYPVVVLFLKDQKSGKVMDYR